VVEHAREHLVWEQADILGEHAKDETVDEVRDGLGRMTALAEALSEASEVGSCLFR
jgi:hypothetical protein